MRTQGALPDLCTGCNYIITNFLHQFPDKPPEKHAHKISYHSVRYNLQPVYISLPEIAANRIPVKGKPKTRKPITTACCIDHSAIAMNVDQGKNKTASQKANCKSPVLNNHCD